MHVLDQSMFAALRAPNHWGLGAKCCEAKIPSVLALLLLKCTDLTHVIRVLQ